MWPVLDNTFSQRKGLKRPKGIQHIKLTFGIWDMVLIDFKEFFFAPSPIADKRSIVLFREIYLVGGFNHPFQTYALVKLDHFPPRWPTISKKSWTNIFESFTAFRHSASLYMTTFLGWKTERLTSNDAKVGKVDLGPWWSFTTKYTPRSLTWLRKEKWWPLVLFRERKEQIHKTLVEVVTCYLMLPIVFFFPIGSAW